MWPFGLGLGLRIGMGLFIPLGVMTCVPNAMLGDHGGTMRRETAVAGITSSAMFFMAGITGLCHGSWMPLAVSIQFATFGVILQLVAFGLHILFHPDC